MQKHIKHVLMYFDDFRKIEIPVGINKNVGKKLEFE
jgi:hypothetical protein